MTDETSVVPTDLAIAKKTEFDTTKLTWFDTLIPAKVADESAGLPYESTNMNKNMKGTPAMTVLGFMLNLVASELRRAGRTVNTEKLVDSGRNELSSDIEWECAWQKRHIREEKTLFLQQRQKKFSGLCNVVRQIISPILTNLCAAAGKQLISISKISRNRNNPVTISTLRLSFRKLVH